MLYETIKERIADGVRTAILANAMPAANSAAILDAFAERRPARQSLTALADLTCKRIMNWDIRCIGKLRELFPEHFPPSLRKGPLRCDFGGDDGWEVYRDND